jgi:SAM-dependent methyltransferase
LEFSYFLKFLKRERLDKDLKILDVSSPHMMAYYLAKSNFVLKTNIDKSERKYIKESKKLKFEVVDGTKMPFADNAFDVTYSISVVEHIYEKYLDAIREMVRVTKIGGIVYITFPVSSEHQEEWVRETIYSDQAHKDEMTFFQYRFSENDVKNIIGGIGGVDVIARDIFWEKSDGKYDKMIARLREKSFGRYFKFLKDSFTMPFIGFSFFEGEPQADFSRARSFGNLQLVLRKKDAVQ